MAVGGAICDTNEQVDANKMRGIQNFKIAHRIFKYSLLVGRPRL